MTTIKEDTSRLADEVHRLKDQRQEFIAHLREEFVPGLKREVAILQSAVMELREGFRTALGESSRSSKMSRTAFSSKLKDQVVEMLGGFREARIQLAHEKKADLQEYMSGLKKQVAGLRHETAGEMAGAREAWIRLSTLGRQRSAEKHPDEKRPDEKRPKKSTGR